MLAGCLRPCCGFYLFSIASFLLFWKWGIGNDRRNWIARYARLSPKHAVTFALVMLLGAYPVVLYHNARKDAQEGAAMRVVSEYYSLPQVHSPSIISTPTMILNDRVVIGTLPYVQLRAIFRALVQEREGGGERKFMENWVPSRRRTR